MPSEQQIWSGQTERLDRVLTTLGLSRSRSSAAQLITAGEVTINGALAQKSGAKVTAGDVLAVNAQREYVSRAAHKLIAALDHFEIDVADITALDLGASTGGFTQVLLERGAEMVVAVDVGHDQLDPQLRGDPRVRVVEGCNARNLTLEELRERSGVNVHVSTESYVEDGAARASRQPDAHEHSGRRIDLIAADLSFISLRLVIPAISTLLGPGAACVFLVKPQFEVGRTGIRDGIVTDEALARAAVADVIACAEEHQLQLQGQISSPITGEHGNQEFLTYFVQGGTA